MAQGADHLRRFLQAAREDALFPLWLLLVSTGARIVEALALSWEDADLTGGTVTFRRAMHRLCGEWVTTTPKTAAGLRTVALPADVLQALHRHRIQQNALRLRAGEAWQDRGLVFTARNGRPFYAKAVGDALAAAIDRAGVPRITAHGFRHTHASLLLQQGMSVATVSARLGHANAVVATGRASVLYDPIHRTAQASRLVQHPCGRSVPRRPRVAARRAKRIGKVHPHSGPD